MAFIIILIALVFHIYFCTAFASYANAKGHDSSICGWMCFFFGIVGYLMVAALPDLEMQQTLSSIERKLNRLEFTLSKTSEQNKSNTPPQPADATLVPPEKATVPTTCDDDHVACPKCSMIQPSNRVVCWYCGQKFAAE